MKAVKSPNLGIVLQLALYFFVLHLSLSFFLHASHLFFSTLNCLQVQWACRNTYRALTVLHDYVVYNDVLCAQICFSLAVIPSE